MSAASIPHRPAKLLIANRGEVAVRIARTAADLGVDTLAVFASDDADGLHIGRCTAAAALPGSGVNAYLDADALLDAARSNGCDAIHPGWGFLSEQATFAAACEAAGLIFVGPTPTQLERLGDKLSARALARSCAVPVLEASEAIEDAQALEAFRDGLAEHATVLIKAAAGGGGRGMRIVAPDVNVAEALKACRAEALAAFGDSTVYAEAFLAVARHVEVQVLGDGGGGVTHLGDRDCSLQRRHQKLVEIAPAPDLPPAMREAMTDAALAMARSIELRGLATFEFLYDTATQRFYFIEANPRLQVEHTVTEATLGLDLVALQLGVAAGATLDGLGLGDGPPAPRGTAIEVRVNAERIAPDGTLGPASGTLTRFDIANGPGVRTDTAAHTGYSVHPAFDSLLAKIIVHTQDGHFAEAVARTRRALGECTVEGIATNLGFSCALLDHGDIRAGALHTRFIDEHVVTLARAASSHTPSQGGLAHAAGPTDTSESPSVQTLPDGLAAVVAPIRAAIVRYDAALGESVVAGQCVATLEAMKMHHSVLAPCTGVLVAIVQEPGTVVGEQAILAHIEPDAHASEVGVQAIAVDLDAPRADLDEVRERHAQGTDLERPTAVAKRRRFAGRTARENVADLCDPDSFIEYGALAIAAQRRRRSVESLMKETPADGLVAGMGTVNATEFGDQAARCAVLAYDYTVLAGTQGHINHKKKDRLFELANEWRLPVVFFTEGGGGRPGDVDTDDVIMSWLDLPTFTTWPRLSGGAPRIAINSGRCFAGNAIIFGCADITIATRNSNIGLAGPAMIEGGGLGHFAPEDIGPIDVQTANGVVDIACDDELEASAVARRVLGCFQGRLDDWACADQRRLRHVVPEDRLRIYNVREAIETLADTGSVVELRRHYGVGIVTALIRIEGHAFGLIANDPSHLGGAIDGPGGEKAGRFLQLCDAYGLPVVSLCDTPGFMVGPDSEETAAVRRGARLIMASANLSVPLFTVVMRKGYGLGAQAMAGGSMHQPLFTIAWPTAEFGPMGLEGAVELGFRKELDAAPDAASRRALYEQLVAGMYEKGKGVSVAQVFEIDAVIDPLDTRAWLVRGLTTAGPIKPSTRRYVDVW